MCKHFRVPTFSLFTFLSPSPSSIQDGFNNYNIESSKMMYDSPLEELDRVLGKYWTAKNWYSSIIQLTFFLKISVLFQQDVSSPLRNHALSIKFFVHLRAKKIGIFVGIRHYTQDLQWSNCKRWSSSTIYVYIKPCRRISFVFSTGETE